MSKQKVTSATQSPMNPVRWSIDLACGHTLWVTSRLRPKAKTQDCRECDKIECGTLVVNGANLGAAERNKETGAIEAGPHVQERARRRSARAKGGGRG